jgi:hypothetical protein
MDGVKRGRPAPHAPGCTCASCRAYARRLDRTLQNDQALDLFCEVILRGRWERDQALYIRQMILWACPLIQAHCEAVWA